MCYFIIFALLSFNNLQSSSVQAEEESLRRIIAQLQLKEKQRRKAEQAALEEYDGNSRKRSKQ